MTRGRAEQSGRFGDDFDHVDTTEVRRHPFGEFGRAAGGQHHPSAIGPGYAQPVDNLGFVGQGIDRRCASIREQEPERDVAAGKCGWRMPDRAPIIAQRMPEGFEREIAPKQVAVERHLQIRCGRRLAVKL